MVHPIVILLALAVAGLNLAIYFLWSRLYSLVHQADPLLGDETAGIYTKYLFMKLMQGPFTSQKSMETLGNPKNDKVVKAVTSSNEYAWIANASSVLKYAPLNFVVFFV